MTHKPFKNVWRDSYVIPECVTKLIRHSRMCDVTHESYKTSHSRSSAVTPLYSGARCQGSVKNVWHDSQVIQECVTWLMRHSWMCDMIHECVTWLMSFINVWHDLWIIHDESFKIVSSDTIVIRRTLPRWLQRVVRQRVVVLVQLLTRKWERRRKRESCEKLTQREVTYLNTEGQ